MGQYFGTSQNGIEDKQSGTEGVYNTQSKNYSKRDPLFLLNNLMFHDAKADFFLSAL